MLSIGFIGIFITWVAFVVSIYTNYEQNKYNKYVLSGIRNIESYINEKKKKLSKETLDQILRMTKRLTREKGKTKVSLNKPQIIPSVKKAKIKFNQEISDTLNEYDSFTNYRFTALKSTFYKINLYIETEIIPDDTKVRVIIEKNGANLLRKQSNVSASTIGKLSLSDTIKIDANDYIDVYVKHNSKDSITITEASLLIEEQ